MRKSCEGCMWHGKCDGKARCLYYDPIDETEEAETIESRRDRRAFRNEWLLYINVDDDVDYCEEPVIFCDVKLIKTNGGD